MDSILYDTLYAGLRVLFIFIIPILIGVSLIGIVASTLQAVTTIRDEAILFSVKLLGVVAILYFTLPSFISALIELTVTVFSSVPSGNIP